MIVQLSNSEFEDPQSDMNIKIKADFIYVRVGANMFTWGCEAGEDDDGNTGIIVYSSPGVRYDEGPQQGQAIGEIVRNQAVSVLKEVAVKQGFFLDLAR